MRREKAKKLKIRPFKLKPRFRTRVAMHHWKVEPIRDLVSMHHPDLDRFLTEALMKEVIASRID